MAEARIRIDWKDDMDLRNDLAKFVRVNLRRLEILDFMRKDYPMYVYRRYKIHEGDKGIKSK